MKKISYLFLAAGIATFAACQSEPSYRVKGTTENIENGDTIYLQEYKGGVMTKLDSTVVQEGSFFFIGRQDSAVNRYITYTKGNKRYFTDLFLENGNIDVKLGEKSQVSGTPNNKIYSEIKGVFTDLQASIKEEYQLIKSNDSLSEEDREKAMSLVEERNNAGMKVIFELLKKNMTNPVGVYLLPQYASAFDTKEQKELLELVSSPFKGDERIQRLQNRIETIEKTAIGQQFTDFEMNTPEGTMVKLSSFISQNKYTLVDFWASWCGPCRVEMPHVVAAYEKYKSKGLGIVGVSLDRDEKKWKEAIQTLKMPWPQMSDLAGWNCEGASLYGVNSIPATVLINQEGIIVARNLRGAALEEKFAELLD
ncbi:MAG: redoxin domain-containing protein [Phocaeicola sp.]